MTYDGLVDKCCQIRADCIATNAPESELQSRLATAVLPSVQAVANEGVATEYFAKEALAGRVPSFRIFTDVAGYPSMTIEVETGTDGRFVKVLSVKLEDE